MTSYRDTIEIKDTFDLVQVLKKTASYTDRIRGLHKEVWKNTDTEEYMKTEKDSWNCNAGD